jgi:hypothetical protein
LTALAADAAVVLKWNAAAGAAGYHLKRSTTNGGPYTIVASVGATNHTDVGLINGTTYYYVVAATNALGVSADSAVASATPIATTIYEAENAILVGAGIANNQSGYSGTGFADYQNASGDYVEWNINAPFSGAYWLQFRYAQATANRPLQLKVNGVVLVASRDFPPTGSWGSWSTVSNNAYLQAGNNTVRLTAIGSSGGNIDYLRRLGGVPATPPQFGAASLQGESALVVNGTGGMSNAPYFVLASTNISLPLSQWTRIQTNQFSGAGNFSFTNTLTLERVQQFFRLQLP